jgi:hypothetical protein
MAERTKGPWHTDDSLDPCAVFDANSMPVAACYGETASIYRANAAAIVRWENIFDELVAALGDLLNCGAAILGASTDDDDAREAFDMYDAARKNARAALAKAKVS